MSNEIDTSKYTSAEDILGMEESEETFAREFEAPVIFEEGKEVSDLEQDLIDDYIYVRETLHSLIEVGQKALAGAMDSALESHHPRSYEVVGGIMKQIADTSDNLMKIKEKIDKARSSTSTNIEEQNNTQNNNYFMSGTTADLKKMIVDIQSGETDVDGLE